MFSVHRSHGRSNLMLLLKLFCPNDRLLIILISILSTLVDTYYLKSVLYSSSIYSGDMNFRKSLFISCFSVVYRRITMDYHSIISLLQAVKLSFIERIGYFRIFPETQSFAIRRSDWLTI